MNNVERVKICKQIRQLLDDIECNYNITPLQHTPNDFIVTSAKLGGGINLSEKFVIREESKMMKEEEIKLNINVKEKNIQRLKDIDDPRVVSLVQSLRIEVDTLKEVLNGN